MTIGQALDILLSFTKTKVSVRVDKSLLRSSDVTLQIPCIDKFTKQTGWKPEIPLEKTLKGMLGYWNDQLTRFPWKSVTVVK